MLFTKTYEDNDLKIKVEELPDKILVSWHGKSITREPRHFIQPILLMIVHLGQEKNIPIDMDFQDLEYMNSSTITPIIRAIEESGIHNQKFCIRYKKSLKWQDLNFSALEIFRAKNSNFVLSGIS